MFIKNNFTPVKASFLLALTFAFCAGTSAYAQMPFNMGNMGGHSASAGSAGTGSHVDPTAFASSAQGVIGVMLQNVNREYYKLPGKYSNAGAYVAYVMSGMPADSAGVKIGDIILEVDGQLVKGFQDFESVFPKASSDGSLSVKLFRNGKEAGAKIAVSASEVTPSGRGGMGVKKGLGPQDIISKMRPGQFGSKSGKGGYSKVKAPYEKSYPGMFIEDMLNKSPIPMITGKKFNLKGASAASSARGAARATSGQPYGSPRSGSRTLKSQVSRRLQISLAAIKLSQELRLTDAQAKGLKSISYDFRIQNIKSRAALEIAKLELDRTLAAKEIDEGDVEKMLENVSELRIKNTISVIKMIKKAEKTLKKEQSAKLRLILGISE